jgi:hypothetical protein
MDGVVVVVDRFVVVFVFAVASFGVVGRLLSLS